MARARRTDSNGLAARWLAARARARTRRRCSFPSDNTASVTSRLLRPPRSAESKTESASSNGRSRLQSTTVRTRLVTQPSTTSPSASVRQWTVARPRALLRSFRFAGIVTSGRSGVDLTFQPQCKAAVRCETVPVIRRATTLPSAAAGTAYTPRPGRTMEPSFRATAMCRQCTARRSSRQEHVPPSRSTMSATARSTRCPASVPAVSAVTQPISPRWPPRRWCHPQARADGRARDE